MLSCEPCEKEFTSETARQAHLQSHVPCPEEGCGFSALKKVVNNHNEAKHGKLSGSGFQVSWYGVNGIPWRRLCAWGGG